MPPIPCDARTDRGSPDRTARRVLLGLVVMLASACTAYHPMPIEPRRSAAAFAARRLDDARVRAAVERLLPQSPAAWPPKEWNRALLLAVAWAENPSLALARAETRSALAREKTAAEIRNPDLTLLSEYARHDAHPWLYGINTSWLIRWSGRRRLAIRIANLQAMSAELSMMDRFWAVRSALTRSLSDLEDARARVDLLDRLAAADRRLIELRRRRVDLGEDASTTLLVAERDRIDAEQQRARALAAADAATAGVARALGLPSTALRGADLVWPDWGRPPPVAANALRGARERALLSRADLAAAIEDYAATEARLQRAVARQYPQIRIGPGYYWDHGIAKFPLDVGFTLPLNGNRGEIAEARADREVAGRRLLALQAQIYGRIEAARSAEHLAHDGLRTAEQALKSARLAENQADLAVRLGEAGAVPRLEASIATIRTELEVLQLRAELQSARNALEDALHAPLSGPELALAAPHEIGGAGAGA